MARAHRPAAAIPTLLKRMNERTVLETIRTGAPISRAEISRRVGISKPTVSLALQSLLDTGLVRRSEEHTSELQSRFDLVCRLLLEKKNTIPTKLTVTSNELRTQGEFSIDRSDFNAK